ncbi:MAG: ribosome maturation factor RimM [Candidatus Caldatribacteriota bacterium]|nr:ribosome maturation factor RimM [Candidatus Caldatribacteriota bacterium]
MSEKFITIGKITSTHGNKGEVKVMPLTDKIDRFKNLINIYIDKKIFEILKSRMTGNSVILKLIGIDKIDEAKKIVGYFIEIRLSEAIKLPEDSYFLHEIIGLDVYLENNEYLGMIENIIRTGSNDVYIVKNKEGREILVPAIKEVIKVIDIDNKKIIIRYVDGLL